jgi:hypothetical protein
MFIRCAHKPMHFFILPCRQDFLLVCLMGAQAPFATVSVLEHGSGEWLAA